MRHELETSRLRLRPCRVEDSARAHELWAEEGVRRFLFDGRAISGDEARTFVEASVESFARDGYGLWLAFARDAGRLVGFAGFMRSEDEAPNLVYGVHPNFWGEGYATEAAGAVLSYALKRLALPRVKADVDEANVESVRVLEKLGMKRVNRAVSEGRPLLYFELSSPGASGGRMGKHLVFVYGTLRRGGVRAMTELFPGSEFVGVAGVRGSLYDFGEYPGLLMGESGSQVVGEVYEIDEGVLKKLDDIEAPAYYSRREVEVSLGGVGVTCWVYEPDLSLYPSRAPIASGDWIEHAKTKAVWPEDAPPEEARG